MPDGVAGRPAPPFSEADSPGVSAAEVTAALDHILSSEAFAHVERPSRFLRHVVEATLRGEQTLLKETLLGIQVFGREPSWDTRIDPIVRQEAARLRKRLARYYETASPEVRIELPVGTYVPVFHRAGSQIAQTGAVVEDAPTAPSVHKLRYGWVALIAVLLFALAGWRFYASRSGAVPPSIVVLPFTNLSADPANEYFADGLTDEITDELVRLNALRVLARTSARALKGKSADVREVGRQLNVAYVLEGSVERSGEQVRISAHLERASDGSHVWSQTYNRPAKDVFAVQSELAAAIARSLRVNSDGASAPQHAPDQEAHDLGLRGHFELENLSPDALSRAEQYFRRAVQIDPQYAGAWAEIGLAIYNRATASGRNPTAAELAETKNLYRKALSLDPALTATRANLGMIELSAEWDWTAAERELQSASRNGPDAAAEAQYGLLLSFRGRFREADQHLDLARALDPLSSGLLTNVTLVRILESRYTESIALSQQLLERYPNQLNPDILMNLTYIEAGQAERALENVRRLEARFPPVRLFEVMALGKLGRNQEGLRLLRQLDGEYEKDTRVYRFWFAMACVALGDHAETLKWLEKSADLHEFQILSLAVFPTFAPMRDDPGFRALLKRIGLN